MKKPELVIMAAGMGSRYGGLKQIDPVDEQGHLIIDFSIYDAVKAGFNDITFVIKHEIEKDFKEAIGNHMEKIANVKYVYQDLNNLPAGYSVPEGRTKPWGTGHAILSILGTVDAPFAVINADDYYGTHAFKTIYDFLATHEDGDKYSYAMVGYSLKNTLTEQGTVARGVCEADKNGMLTNITERTKIRKNGDGAQYSEDDGNTWTDLNPDSIVSMNLWGFTPSILKELKAGFPAFLDANLKTNPLKCEYFLPTVVDNLIKAGKAEAKVLTSLDRWYGVTYKEDKAVVVQAFKDLKAKGVYPEQLWDR